MHFYYDAQSRPAIVNFNGAYYMYLHNLQGDIVGLVDSGNNIVVEYKYDAWGKTMLKRSLTTAYDTLATLNPFRYRGYIYDEASGLYYLRSRFYNPVWGRFVSIDALEALWYSISTLSNKNLFAYCDNNSIARMDCAGEFWETIFDVISFGASVVEVALNPRDPLAWAALVGDTIDLLPFVSGIGELTRAVKTTVKTVEAGENIIQTARKLYRLSDVTDDIRIATGSYEILYDSGKNYVGKGGFGRAIQSAVEHTKNKNGNSISIVDAVNSIRWKSAPNTKQAFIDEFFMQKKFKVGNINTYNKIWSPGKRIYEEMLKK